MKELDPVAFTVQLGRLYEQSRKSGTVSVTMKRMTERRVVMATKTKKETPKGGEAVLDKTRNPEDVQYPCLVRATFKNTKLSTVVPVEDLDKFQNAYTTVIKAYMDSLKKKERTRKPKKQKTAA
ncbi:signal recognition particle, SRP9/SRP14 subunit [Dichotomocladium elegans]|nr:signal recognition particle, SRP9/SRP14 subunit [Dichotomocladium elegans]